MMEDAMFVVMDWYRTQIYGPFLSRDAAEEWLARQEIYLDQYYSREVSVMELQSTKLKLPVI
jgi:hypothetical protein